MAFTFFTSADSGAPTLNGTAGSGTSVLDWVLNTKGGWPISYTGTNKRVYRQLGGNQRYLRVVDDGTAAGNAYNMVVRAAEGATGIDTVTDSWPTTAQCTDANSCWLKSSAAGSTARAYYGWVTDTAVCIMVQYNGTNWEMWLFGDCVSTVPSDPYNTFIGVQPQSTGGLIYSRLGASDIGNLAANGVGGFMCRNYNGTVKSVYAGFHGCTTSSLVLGLGYCPYPDPMTNKLLRRYARVSTSGSASSGTLAGSATAEINRGFFPNLWFPYHSTYTGISDGQTFDDTEYNATALFKLFRNANGTAFYCLETTNTWAAP